MELSAKPAGFSATRLARITEHFRRRYIDEGKIAALIDHRLAARKAKNFKEADRIRDELAKNGVILEDGPKGTTWRRAG